MEELKQLYLRKINKTIDKNVEKVYFKCYN